jgi:hypothetical protein
MKGGQTLRVMRLLYLTPQQGIEHRNCDWLFAALGGMAKLKWHGQA